MNAEFNWWLLIVGLVVGAGLVWLVVADSRRREADVGEVERESEARWIAQSMTDAGRRIGDADVLDVLHLHAAYLAASPPDEPFEDDVDDVFARDVSRRPVAPGTEATRPVAGERRSMAHPVAPDRPDHEGGQA